MRVTLKGVVIRFQICIFDTLNTAGDGYNIRGRML